MMKKGIACLLAVLQLALLLPAAARAADTAETPVLNETIVGAMQYATFSFSSGVTAPDGETQWEGGDYVKPFFFSDDYFAAPAYDVVPDTKALTWRELENPALVTASMDLSLAAFGTNEHMLAGEFDDYSKNAEDYLAQCGFGHIVTNDVDDPAAENKFNRFPSKDSIGVVLGAKDINVWNGTENESCTLIAVGVRGGGYAGEWASNLTLGQEGRHLGFDRSTQKVLATLRGYLQSLGLTADDHVKYWLTGNSRGGAVANLAAGDICDAPETYFAAKQDVYCYTFESPAGAVAAEDPDGTAYPNIHNILNRMDAVPRVSPVSFGHIRLGTDYYLPDHTNTDRVADYYRRMYRALESVAVGYGNEIDPVVKNADPETYPYDRPVEIYNFSLQALVSDISSTGLQPYRDWRGTPIGRKDGEGYSLYIDEFLDQFVEAFVGSRAWDYDPAHPTDPIKLTDPITHRAHYADPARGIEEGLRTITSAALSTPGSSLGGMFSGIGGAIPSIILPAGQLLLKLKGNYDLVPTESGAQSMAEDVSTILKAILLQSASFQELEPEVSAAAEALSPVLTRLFLYDRMNYGSQYLGTLLKYAGSQIIVSHISEQSAAWSEALDEDHIGNYRALTVPKEADVKLIRFRAGIDEPLSMDGEGTLIAEARNGAITQSIDGRVTVTDDGTLQTVCFPAYLDLRAEITLPDGARTEKLPLQLAALSPTEGRTSWHAGYDRDPANGNIVPESVSLAPSLTSAAAEPGMEKINDAAVALTGGETLLITCGASTADYESPAQGDFDLALRGGNTVQNETARSGHAVLASRLFETETGDYTLTVTVRALQRIAGKTLTVQLNDKDFDLQNAACAADGAETAIRNGAAQVKNVRLEPGESCTLRVTGLVPVAGGTLTAAEARFDDLRAASRTVVEARADALDYGADQIIAERVLRLSAASEAFRLEGGVLRFDFPALRLLGENTTRAAAVMLGVPEAGGAVAFHDDGRVWLRHEAVPASSIYFDDSFANDAIPGSPGDNAFSLDTQMADTVDPANGQGVTKDFFFRFRGSRIDLYCTADTNAGYVSAGVFDENGTLLDSTLVTGRSKTTRYHEPTVSFDGLDANRVYCLQLRAIAGANYRLDGIRVYNPLPDGTQYLRVRELLADGRAIRDGANEPGASTTLLRPGEGLALRVDRDDALALGLSAPEGGGAAAAVSSADGTPVLLNVDSALDRYFPVAPEGGRVLLVNTGSTPLAVTNVRLAPGARVLEDDALRIALDAFRKLAPQAEPAPAPTPTQEELALTVQALLNQLANTIFAGIARLFAK